MFRFTTLLLLPALTLAFPHNRSNHTAQEVIELFKLEPNIEKGYFRQNFVDSRTVPGTNRSLSTAIYYLLERSAGFSYWHKVDAVEVWYVLTFHCSELIVGADLYRHHYAGAPMTMEMSWDNGTATEKRVLGGDVFKGEEPQRVVQAQRWQRVRSEGEWTLVGTTMGPGFSESGFEMRQDWMPNDGCSSVM